MEYYQKRDGKEFSALNQGDSVTSIVPTGKSVLILGVLTSSDSIWKAFGNHEISLRADLKPGGNYEVKLERNGEHLKVWIVDSATGTPASQTAIFDVRNPIIVPIPMAL